MTDLEKKVVRKSAGRVFSAGQNRRVLIVLIPPAKIGLRLEGTRQTYTLDVEVAYAAAVDRHLRDVEKRAKEIVKLEKRPIRSARAKARKELDKRLKV
jgi:phosphoglucomutase